MSLRLATCIIHGCRILRCPFFFLGRGRGDEGWWEDVRRVAIVAATEEEVTGSVRQSRTFCQGRGEPPDVKGEREVCPELEGKIDH